MTQLSPNFSLEELTHSDIGMRRGIANAPDPEQTANLVRLATLLEEVRLILHHPMHITSGFRCPELNALVGGSQTSGHMDGRCADFVSPSFGSPYEVGKFIAESGMRFDQLIYEGKWVHIGIPRMGQAPRLMILTATFDTNGKPTYTQGIA